MDNLTDYIRWMGDIPFDRYPLNEADALVLCMLSYYDFSPLFSARAESRPLRDSLRLIEDDRVRVMLVGRDRGFRALLEYAARSRRYGELMMRDYVDLRRQEPPLQFAALCFDAPEFRFVAYRGTDASLAGWEEDFMISFTITEAQELAARYAREHASDSRPMYIGGHSKGGNLALYAACGLPEEQWRQVEHVYLLDGPGLCPEVMGTDCIQRIDPKTTRILPTFSVVGKLFEPPIRDSRIVYSSASGIVQHSLDTWGIDHGKLALAPEASPRSRWINETISRWIEGISQENRAVFVRELFDALAANGAESLEDIEANGVSGFEAILGKLFSSSEVTRETIYDLPKRAILGEHYDAIEQIGFSSWLRQRLREHSGTEAEASPDAGKEQEQEDVF